MWVLKTTRTGRLYYCRHINEQDRDHTWVQRPILLPRSGESDNTEPTESPAFTPTSVSCESIQRINGQIACTLPPAKLKIVLSVHLACNYAPFVVMLLTDSHTLSSHLMDNDEWMCSGRALKCESGKISTEVKVKMIMAVQTGRSGRHRHWTAFLRDETMQWNYHRHCQFQRVARESSTAAVAHITFYGRKFYGSHSNKTVKLLDCHWQD